MTRLHLVRHGPTHAKSMVGWSDLPADLSDAAALSRLSAYLPQDAVVVSSDLLRAVATADAIQMERPRLAHDRKLRELHFGTWELRRFAEIEAEDPDRIRAYWEHPGDVRPPGGESWNELRHRVDGAINGLISAHEGRDLIIVVHFGVILSQLQRALEIDTETAFGYRIDNLSVTQIEVADTGWQAHSINHCP